MDYKELNKVLSLHPYWRTLNDTSKKQVVNTSIANIWKFIGAQPINYTPSISEKLPVLPEWYLIGELNSETKVKQLGLEVPDNLKPYIYTYAVKKIGRLLGYNVVVTNKGREILLDNPNDILVFNSHTIKKSIDVLIIADINVSFDYKKIELSNYYISNDITANFSYLTMGVDNAVIAGTINSNISYDVKTTFNNIEDGANTIDIGITYRITNEN